MNLAEKYLLWLKTTFKFGTFLKAHFGCKSLKNKHQNYMIVKFSDNSLELFWGS